MSNIISIYKSTRKKMMRNDVVDTKIFTINTYGSSYLYGKTA